MKNEEKKLRILAFAGSTRKDSLNKKLIRSAVEIAETYGAEVTYIDLRDLPMPLYDGDLEAESGIPENGKKFMDLLITHDSFMISSPEYNSSFSAVLKNSIDWASRPAKDVKTLAAFDGKIVLLMSASPGSLGGLRGLYSLRSMLTNIKSIVIPGQLALSNAKEEFDEEGKLKSSRYKDLLNTQIKHFIEFSLKLKQP